MLTLVFAGSVRYRVPAHAGLAVLAGAAYAAMARRLLGEDLDPSAASETVTHREDRSPEGRQ
ncbi:MAG: hypothetical protein ACYTFI_04465 [Planctomycetota bacterium]|jgi:hypothetical protein